MLSSSRALEGSARSAERAAELDDVLARVAAGVVDVDAPARGVVGGEGEREQALLVAREHPRAQVEERAREAPAVADDDDPPVLLDDQDPPAVAGRSRDEERLVEAPDRHEAHARTGRRRRRRRGGARGGAGARRGRVAGAAGAQEHEQGEGERKPVAHAVRIARRL